MGGTKGGGATKWDKDLTKIFVPPLMLAPQAKISETRNCLAAKYVFLCIILEHMEQVSGASRVVFLKIFACGALHFFAHVAASEMLKVVFRGVVATLSIVVGVVVDLPM